MPTPELTLINERVLQGKRKPLPKKPDGADQASRVDDRAIIETVADLVEHGDEKAVRDAIQARLQASAELAWVYVQFLGDVQEAQRYAEMALQMVPDDPSIADTLGWIYYKQGKYNEAVTEFKKSIEKLPENPTIRYHLGAAYMKLDDKASAKPHLERAVKLGEKERDFKELADAKKLLEQAQ